MKNKMWPTLVFRRSLCAVLALVLVLSLAACGSKAQEPLRATEEVKIQIIETRYGPLGFPADVFGSLRHTEVTEGNTTMEVFYMVGQGVQKEVFRIYFAAANMGTQIGYLTVDGVEIPVSYSLCEYEDENFETEDERKLYYGMMEGFNAIMNSIHDDPRFSETRAVAPVADREVKLRYWKVTLPENVQFTETEENGNYRVDFYGEVSGERIDLFMIGLGDMEAETMLGLYTVDGNQMPVMVQTYSLDDYAIWPEEEQTVIYKMMGALNTVIQTIVEDENFAEPESGT